jgi:hypothetical protein
MKRDRAKLSLKANAMRGETGFEPDFSSPRSFARKQVGKAVQPGEKADSDKTLV